MVLSRGFLIDVFGDEFFDFLCLGLIFRVLDFWVVEVVVVVVWVEFEGGFLIGCVEWSCLLGVWFGWWEVV